MFSRWLSQVREMTSSLLQVSLHEKGIFRQKKKTFLWFGVLTWSSWNRPSLPGPRLVLYLDLMVTLPLLETVMLVKGESCGRAGSWVAFPNLSS